MTTWYQAYFDNILLFLDALKMLHSAGAPVRARLKTAVGLWQVKQVRARLFSDERPPEHCFRDRVRAPWEILSQQTMTVFVGAALPGRMRPAKVRAQAQAPLVQAMGRRAGWQDFRSRGFLYCLPFYFCRNSQTR